MRLKKKTSLTAARHPSLTTLLEVEQPSRSPTGELTTDVKPELSTLFSRPGKIQPLFQNQLCMKKPSNYCISITFRLKRLLRPFLSNLGNARFTGLKNLLVELLPS